MNYIYELSQEEKTLLDRICVVLTNLAINKSLLLKIVGIDRMVLVNYISGKRCSFTSDDIANLKIEIQKVRSEIKNAFLSGDTMKISTVLRNKEILYYNLLNPGLQVKLSPVRTGRRKVTIEESKEIKDIYLKLALQMNL